jgi:excisionase family DNA binding protein
MTSIINEAEASTADPKNETLVVPPAVLSVAQAAELLGISEWLVLQQIRLGNLPHKRCGRRIVLSRQRLMAWLNES